MGWSRAGYSCGYVPVCFGGAVSQVGGMAANEHVGAEGCGVPQCLLVLGASLLSV